MIQTRSEAKSLLQTVEKLEAAMLKETQVECPVVHHFGPGIYMREVSIPQGTLAVGHFQNFTHQNIFLKGRVVIINDNGTTTDMRAPMCFVGKPGRKIGYVIEDLVWLNVYATDETDVEKLEAKYLTKSQAFIETKNSKAFKSLEDQGDFLMALKELGVDEKTVKDQSENELDMNWVPPFGAYRTRLADSPIHGRGLFTTSSIKEGELIMPARVKGLRTMAGRFTNHSKKPNAMMVRGPGTDIDLIAIKNISGCHGGMDGEEITIDYREAFRLTQEIAMEEKCQA